jgi:hypothetical protein
VHACGGAFISNGGAFISNGCTKFCKSKGGTFGITSHE